MNRAEIYQCQPPEEGIVRENYHAELHDSELLAYYDPRFGLPVDADEPAKPATGAEDIVYGAWVALRIALWIGTPLATAVAVLWLFREALS